jgi:20S proteasome alpha/beta subunit
MAQLIAAHNAHGIVLAADSRAIHFDNEGNPIPFTVDRLLPLGDRAAILAGGAAQTVDMARSLQAFVSSEGLTDIEDIYMAAVPFLGSEYARFMRKECQTLHLDPLLFAYFILAGYTERDPKRPSRLYFLWTKKRLPQLDGDEITHAFTVPRHIGLEARLARLCRAEATSEEILGQVREHLEKLGRDQDNVGGPFAVATITADGLRHADLLGIMPAAAGYQDTKEKPARWH